GTQTSASLGRARVHSFRTWSYGPSRNDEEVKARQAHFPPALKAGVQEPRTNRQRPLYPRFRGNDEIVGSSAGMDAAPVLGDLAAGADPHPVAGGDVIEEFDQPGDPA